MENINTEINQIDRELKEIEDQLRSTKERSFSYCSKEKEPSQLSSKLNSPFKRETEKFSTMKPLKQENQFPHHRHLRAKRRQTLFPVTQEKEQKKFEEDTSFSSDTSLSISDAVSIEKPTIFSLSSSSVPTLNPRNIAEKDSIGTASNRKENHLFLSPSRRPQSLCISRDAPSACRIRVLSEIYCTERAYVNDLDLISRVFILPLTVERILPKEKIEIIFSNLSILLKINRELLKEMERGTINAFEKMLPRFSAYGDYCANQTRSTTCIQDCKKEFPEFCKFLQRCFRLPECRLLELEAFLIKPMQRITKYPLLFQELLKVSDETDPDFPTLKRVSTTIKQLVNSINESKRASDNLAKMIEIRNQITEKSKMTLKAKENYDLNKPDRQFIREGILIQMRKPKKLTTSEEEGYYLLFDDSLLHTQRKKTSSKLMVKEVFKEIGWVEVVHDENISHSESLFKLIIEKGNGAGITSIFFLAKSTVERDAWVKDLLFVSNRRLRKGIENTHPQVLNSVTFPRIENYLYKAFALNLDS